MCPQFEKDSKIGSEPILVRSCPVNLEDGHSPTENAGRHTREETSPPGPWL